MRKFFNYIPLSSINIITYFNVKIDTLKAVLYM